MCAIKLSNETAVIFLNFAAQQARAADHGHYLSAGTSDGWGGYGTLDRGTSVFHGSGAIACSGREGASAPRRARPAIRLPAQCPSSYGAAVRFEAPRGYVFRRIGRQGGG